MTAVDTQKALVLENLTCWRSERLLFTDVNVRVTAGRGLRILGHNGIGKTSLLRVIAGLSSEYKGVIAWQDASVTRALRPAECLFLGHKPAVNAQLSPLENLRWWAGINGLVLDDEVLVTALSSLGLSACLYERSYSLSAGQQRRVALSRMAVSQSFLWVLDEPFTAIDKAGVDVLLNYIQQHCQRGGVVIMTTHQSVVLPNFSDLLLSEYLDTEFDNMSEDSAGGHMGVAE